MERRWLGGDYSEAEGIEGTSRYKSLMLVAGCLTPDQLRFGVRVYPALGSRDLRVEGKGFTL